MNQHYCSIQTYGTVLKYTKPVEQYALLIGMKMICICDMRLNDSRSVAWSDDVTRDYLGTWSQLTHVRPSPRCGVSTTTYTFTNY